MLYGKNAHKSNPLTVEHRKLMFNRSGLTLKVSTYPGSGGYDLTLMKNCLLGCSNNNQHKENQRNLNHFNFLLSYFSLTCAAAHNPRVRMMQDI